ncbi:zeta toxin family protein [Arenimonas sp.]|uniref:zeta toxin family protein n=1 Tax=Arenimonas sp. TaxID=1872635 RepID=UPI0039E5DD30
MAGLFDPNADDDLQAALDTVAYLQLNPFDFSKPRGLNLGESSKGLLRPAAGVVRTTATIGGLAPPFLIDKALGGDLQDRYFKTAVDDFAQGVVDTYTPDAMSMSTASQTLNTVLNVGGSLPFLFASPEAFLANAAVDPAMDLTGQGVDTNTATGVGLLNLGVNAVGLRLPAAWGSTLGPRLATGVGSNLALGMGADAATAGLLDANGYDEHAALYDWSNLQTRTLDTLMGLAFGAKAHIDAPRVKRSEGDAVLVANNADHFNRRTLPGEPLTKNADLQHQRALTQAIEQLARGERVNVADKINPADFMLRPDFKNLDKPASGMVRVYHGGSVPGDKLQGDVWFSTDRTYARDYGNRSGQSGGDVYYLDIPEAMLERDLENGYPGLHSIALPDHMAKNMRPDFEPATPGHLRGGDEPANVQQDFRSIAAAHDATITSMQRGVIKRGAGARSQHPHGTAADFRTFDKTDAEVRALMADLRSAGFEVIDERNTDQPHIHAELPPGGRRMPVDPDTALRQRLQDDPAKIAAEYAALPDSQGGRVLNTDTARELSPEYLADRTRSADVHEAASETVKQLYAAKLAQPTPAGLDPVVLFTAGGTGAGKSTAVRQMASQVGQPEIVYDTNMNSLDSAVRKVEQALEAGRDVNILYVYRDPVEALTGGAIPRAQRQAETFGSGRTVPLDEHARTHSGVRPVMEALAERYRDDQRVTIHAFDNSRGAGKGAQTSLESLPRVEENTLRERLQDALHQARDAGLSDDLFRGFSVPGRQAAVLGTARLQEPRGIQPGAGERPGGKPQQERGQVGDSDEAMQAAQVTAAEATLAEFPGLQVVDETGNLRPAAELLADADAELIAANDTIVAMDVATDCYLRSVA